jgi:tetratricopeptide (TPR) repeat protein
MKSLKLFLLLAIVLLSTACNDNPKEDPKAKSPEKPAPEPQTKYVQKGAFLSDGGASTFHFLEAKSLEMKAEAANAFIDSLRTAYQADSTNSNTQFALGTYFATSVAFLDEGESGGPRCDSAVILLSKVIETNAMYLAGAAYFNRAQAYFCQENWQAATSDLEKYIEMDPDPSAYALLGLSKTAYEQGDSSKACAYFAEFQSATEGSWDSTLKVWEERCQ